MPAPTMTIRGSRFPGMAGWWVWVISVVTLCLPKPARQALRSVPVFVVLQELLGVVVGVGAGLAVVEMRWWDPFGDAVVALAGGPALFGELVVRAASQGQPVDVGGVGFRPGRDVVDFGEVPRYVAARRRAATILGVDVRVVHYCRRHDPHQEGPGQGRN